MNNKNLKKGFTMVELALAMIFISIILITIAWLTMHITAIYEKGLAMKTVNATAKELIDDYSRAIAGSPAYVVEVQCGSYYKTTDAGYQLCVKDNARKFTYQQRYGMVTIKGGDTVLVPTNGVFCTGRYSYIWNTAYVLNNEDYTPGLGATKGRFYIETGGIRKLDNENYRLLKVQDFDRSLCKQHLSSNKNLYAYDANSDYVLDFEPGVKTDLLDKTENNLAIYDMTIFSPTIHKVTSAGYYSGTFILATLRGGIDITATGDFCTDPPDGLSTDFTYCAINKFNFSMRASGEKRITER